MAGVLSRLDTLGLYLLTEHAGTFLKEKVFDLIIFKLGHFCGDFPQMTNICLIVLYFNLRGNAEEGSGGGIKAHQLI